MKYLADANLLISFLDPDHERHADARVWIRKVDASQVALCPIVELAWLRIMGKRSSMTKVRQVLDRAVKLFEWIPCDLKTGHSPSPMKTTDFYLADLAQAKGMKLATFDSRMEHPAAHLIARQNSLG